MEFAPFKYRVFSWKRSK